MIQDHVISLRILGIEVLGKCRRFSLVQLMLILRIRRSVVLFMILLRDWQMAECKSDMSKNFHSVKKRCPQSNVS